MWKEQFFQPIVLEQLDFHTQKRKIKSLLHKNLFKIDQQPNYKRKKTIKLLEKNTKRTNNKIKNR